MKKRHFVAAGIAASLLLAAPVFAKDHGNGHGKGHDKHENMDDDRREEVRQGAYFNDHHREEVRSYYVQHYGEGKGCPPGLAKKHNGCMPPGQARKWEINRPLAKDIVYYEIPRRLTTELGQPPAG